MPPCHAENHFAPRRGTTTDPRPASREFCGPLKHNRPARQLRPSCRSSSASRRAGCHRRCFRPPQANLRGPSAFLLRTPHYRSKNCITGWFQALLTPCISAQHYRGFQVVRTLPTGPHYITIRVEIWLSSRPLITPHIHIVE